MRHALVPLLALALSGCGGSTAPETTASAATTPADATAACTPPFNPTGALGLPGVRVGDDPTSTEIAQQDAEKGTLSGSPLDQLPPHIRLLSTEGARPAWSPDGTHLIYLDASIGDVVEFDLATRSTRQLTKPYATAGFLRAQYLPNGDLLLCGPQQRDPAIEDDGRFRGELWVQRAPFDHAPILLGESCWEGIAADAQSDEIAWNVSDIDFNAADVFVQAVNGKSEIHSARLVYDHGMPRLTDQKLVINRWDVSPDSILELQDFRTRADGSRELIFSTYFHRGGEVMGVNLQTGAITGYSRSPFYEEAEGIDPAGQYVMVERDRAVELFPSTVEIWRLALDGSGRFERLTEFTRYCGYGADQPVVAPDGRSFVFMMDTASGPQGAGAAMLLFDLEQWNAAHPQGGAPDPFLLPPEIIVPLPL